MAAISMKTYGDEVLGEVLTSLSTIVLLLVTVAAR